MIIGVRDDVAEKLGIELTDQLWSSQYSDEANVSTRPTIAPPESRTRSERRTLGAALFDIDEKLPASLHRPDRSYSKEMRSASTWGLPSTPHLKGLPNREFRQHRDSTVVLFRLLQILSSSGLLHDAKRARVADFDPTSVATLKASAIASATFPISSPDGELTFETVEDLVETTKRRLTRKHSQTVLRWAEPSQTVVTIPDDYIHPFHPRTFSVRELARLQGFPDGFTFYGKVTTGGTSRKNEVPQYSQVGNAVSPFVAFAIGTTLNELCDRYRSRKTQ
jgi:DNA (cytosine-5)-methyltransferase 1